MGIVLRLGCTLQLNIEVKYGENIVENPDLIYSSSNTDIIIIDNNGLITAQSEGTATITVILANDTSKTDSILITVKPVPVSHNYSITITGSDTVKKGYTQTYTAKFYDNGVEVSDKTGVWSIDNTNYATIQSQTGNSCVVKGGTTTGVTVVLRCTLSDDSNVFAEKSINVISLF